MKNQIVFFATALLFTVVCFSQDKPTKVENDSVKKNDLDEVIVTSYRTNSRIENIPTRVEVLGQDDLIEENGVKPGNIMSLLSDVAGIQMQQVSASSGNTFARIQGLNGRYTQILKDGMPLFGGMSGSFGIMQIPPMDLKQIEIIKGSASTLYGGDAIGGIINLISKNPSFDKELSLSVNQSTLSETNFNGYFSQRLKKIGFTLFAGQNFQKEKDIDGDGLSDVASVNSTVIHPKLIFYFSPISTLSFNYTGTFDTRKGGDMNYFSGENSSLYHVSTAIQRQNADVKWLYNLSENNNFTLKASSSILNENLGTKNYNFDAKQIIYYSEASYFHKIGKMNWVAGINFNGDVFDNNSMNLNQVKNYRYSTFGAFVQNTYKPTEKLTVESGFRTDFHSKFGTFPLPRLSLLYKINAAFSSRINGGFGYKVPNYLNYIDLETDLQNLIANSSLKAELSRGLNADINYKKVFANDLDFTFNQSFFYTKIKNPIYNSAVNSNQVYLDNAAKGLITKGFQSYARLDYGHFELYLGYVFTDVRKKYDSQNQHLVVTPKHNFSSTLFYELSNNWRFGIESSLIAGQLNQNYQPVKNYTLFASMIQYNAKKFTLVLNAENLLNFKQSKYGRIYSGTISNPQFDKLWAPIDGRVVNLSLKYNVFKK